MSRSPYHFRFHDDALRGYAKLSLEQRGAYTTLLDLMYSYQEYLEEDERRLAAELGVSMRKYRTLRDQLIRAGKLYYAAPGMLSNRRFEKEIARKYERSEKARLAGRTGGRKKAENRDFRNEINESSKLNPSSSINQNKNNNGGASLTKGDCGTGDGEHDHLPSHIVQFRKRQRMRGM